MSEPYFTSALIIIEIIFSLMVLNTLRKTGANNTLLMSISIILSGWLIIVFMMLSNGFFMATGMHQLAFTAGIAMPVVAGLLAFNFNKSLSQTITNIPLSHFLKLQYMRAAFGVMFFFTSSLPVWFQYIGGLGDIAAGIGAYLAVQYLGKHPDRENQVNIRGNIIGILDFVLVLMLGAGVVLQTQSPDIMFDLIPLYVVPIFILLHVFSLLKLRAPLLQPAGVK